MEADQNTKGHFFAMERMVARRNGCKPIVDCMSAGQTSRFEAYAREECVSLHNPFQSWGNNLCFTSGDCNQTINENGVVAQPGNG